MVQSMSGGSFTMEDFFFYYHIYYHRTTYGRLDQDFVYTLSLQALQKIQNCFGKQLQNIYKGFEYLRL